PAVVAVNGPAAPPGTPIRAADAGKLAVRRRVRPIRIELEIVPEVDFLLLRAETFAESIGKRGPAMLATRDGDTEALALAAEGLVAFNERGVLRLLLAAPGLPPVVLLEIAIQDDVRAAGEITPGDRLRLSVKSSTQGRSQNDEGDSIMKH